MKEIYHDPPDTVVRESAAAVFTMKADALQGKSRTLVTFIPRHDETAQVDSQEFLAHSEGASETIFYKRP